MKALKVLSLLVVVSLIFGIVTGCAPQPTPAEPTKAPAKATEVPTKAPEPEKVEPELSCAELTLRGDQHLYINDFMGNLVTQYVYHC